MTRLITALRTFWGLAVPYFRSEDKWAGRGLLGAIIAIELGIVGITVLLNQWNARFYDALQNKDVEAFKSELLYFCVLAVIFIVGAVYQLYLNQWLQIRWRKWMTERYLGAWMADGRHYRMKLTGEAADNPDQRIAEDIQMFVGKTLSIGVGLLGSLVSLASFVVILWGLSAAAPLTIGGVNVAIPGYLVWAALVYSIIGTIITHLIGRQLVPLNFDQQRYEADFRFALVRLRENGEAVALMGGEPLERAGLLGRFSRVMDNWFAIMSRQKKLTFFTAGYSQISMVFPFLVVSPAYFSGAMQLGGLMQTGSAFGRVDSALSFFISSYTQLAEWKAVIDRLAGFEAGLARAEAERAVEPRIAVERGQDGALILRELDVRVPGRDVVLIRAGSLELPAGERALLSGPSGSGKTSLFRAIAGIWPFGQGEVRSPADIMVLPQRPYLPLGTLRAALAYPAEPEAFTDAEIREALADVGLSALASRLDETSTTGSAWAATLSGGEQQRVALARALLHKPKLLLLDEATSALDEPAETVLYAHLVARLPGATIISITHRDSLDIHHERKITVREGGLELT